MIKGFPDGHHKLIGSVLLVYGGYMLYEDFTIPTQTQWYNYIGDAFVALVGLGLIF